MSDYFFMICRTCKTVKWCADDELPGYIEDHQGHSFTILTFETRDNDDAFREWFLQFMDWPEEEAA